MMRSKFDEQLTKLNGCLLEMAEHVSQIITFATKAFLKHDLETARHAIEYDHEIDNKEKEIEGLCLKLLLRQQPVAKDLRIISSALKIITDLEHIGDQASEIANLTLNMRGMTDKKEIEYITKMSDAAVYMVNSSINAFVSDDLDLATKVIANDDIIDELFGKAKDRLVETLRKDSSDCEQAIDLLMTAKYFERIGDHTATIAGWVVFSITGTHTYKIDEVINMEV